MHSTRPTKALATALVLSLSGWSTVAPAAERLERGERIRLEQRHNDRNSPSKGSLSEKNAVSSSMEKTADAVEVNAAPEVTIQDATSLVRTQILTLINQARAVSRVCGTISYPAVGPLVLNAKLNLASDRHAVDMATFNYFSHTGRDGSTPWQRMNRVGYTFRTAAENIAAGYSTPAAVVAGWLKSAGHCKNIMGASFKDLGVGYGFSSTSTYKNYWVTMYASPTTTQTCS